MKSMSIPGDYLYITHRKDECVPDNISFSHCHDKYEILYVVDGTGKYIVEGVEYPIKPRSIILIPPLSYHCAQIDKNCEYDRFIIHFEKKAVLDCVSEAFSSINEISQFTGAYYPPEAVSDSIVAVFERFEQIDRLPEKERDICMALYLAELLLLLSAGRSEFYMRDDGELGARVIRYLNRNLDRDISLDSLAKRFFVSKYYLCRAFKKHNGISIHGYINKKRVTYAKQLIESGETASGAAYRVGFGDYSAFYRAYVKLIGRAPTQQEERIDDGI